MFVCVDGHIETFPGSNQNLAGNNVSSSMVEHSIFGAGQPQVFSYIRRLRPFLGFKILKFNVFH